MLLCWWRTTVVLLIVKLGMVLWWCCPGVAVLTTSALTPAGRCCGDNPSVAYISNCTVSSISSISHSITVNWWSYARV
jgi:hypothetical protein